MDRLYEVKRPLPFNHCNSLVMNTGELTCQLHMVLPGGLSSSRESSSSQTSHNLGLGRLGARRLGLVDDARTGSETRGAFELRYRKKEKQTTKAQMRAMEV